MALNRIRFVLALSLLVPALEAQSPQQPVRRPADPGVITTRQAITPAGVQSVFDGRVYGVTFGNDSNSVWVLTSREVFELGWAENAVRQRIESGLAPGLQGLTLDPTSDGVLAAGTNRTRQAGLPSRVRLAAAAAQAARDAAAQPALRIVADRLGENLAGSVTAARQPRAGGRRIAIVPLVYDNAIAVVDLAVPAVAGTVEAGIAVSGAAMDPTGTVAWVSNWGGRPPRAGEPSATTGEAN